MTIGEKTDLTVGLNEGVYRKGCGTLLKTADNTKYFHILEGESEIIKNVQKWLLGSTSVCRRGYVARTLNEAKQ